MFFTILPTAFSQSNQSDTEKDVKILKLESLIGQLTVQLKAEQEACMEAKKQLIQQSQTPPQSSTDTETNSLLDNELKKVKSKVDEITAEFPLSIEGITFASMNKSGSTTYIKYGDTLYASKIYYLRVRVDYKSYTSSDSINVSVKISDPTGKIFRNSSTSPKNFTYNWILYPARVSRSLGGWGSDKGGSFYAGEWRIEVWYNEKCLGAKSFIIYE
jgi:hypothetical protein